MFVASAATETSSIKEVLDNELSKFFSVAEEYTRQTGLSAMMPKCIVDAHWHDMLADLPSFDAFTGACVGEGITVEHIEAGGVDPIAWVPLYESAYGPLDRVWFTAADETFAVAEYDEYLRTGETPKMAWDCTPYFRKEEPTKSK